MDTDVKPLLISEEPETVWSNERILEFLERYRAEPCLWDCRLSAYSMRVAQGDAWRRLADSLSWSATLHDLKKRRDSLMGYYRQHVDKYKEARATGCEYRPRWFAFRSMHNFLAPIYAGDSPPGSEVALPPNPKNMEDNKRRRKIILNKAKPYETTTQRKRRLAKAKRKREEKKEMARIQQLQEGRVVTWMCGQAGGQVGTPDGEGSQSPHALPVIMASQTLKRSPSDHYEEPPSSPQFFPLPGPYKTESSDSQFDQVSAQTRYNVDQVSDQTSYDEFDHFGLMIASKVRRIDNFEERETVMNVIQNIVYQSVMKSRQADLPS